MAVNIEGKYRGEFVICEAPGNLSKENVTVKSGRTLGVGAVVGRVGIGVGKADIPTVAGAGNGLMSALFAGPDVEAGKYVVTCIEAVADGGVFSVVSPSGESLPNLTLGVGAGGTTVYRSSHINFSITDGGTDFAVDDSFTITVGAGAPSVVGTGDGTVSGLTLGRHAKPGRYRVECIRAVSNGGGFKIVGPDGDEVAVGDIVAGAGGALALADQEQLNITITEGGTDFAVLDFFEVFAFNQGEREKGQVAAWDPQPSAFDGRQHAAGILYGAVDASAAEASGVIVARQAEVRESDLEWLASVSVAEKEAAKRRLSELGIAVR